MRPVDFLNDVRGYTWDFTVSALAAGAGFTPQSGAASGWFSWFAGVRDYLEHA